MDASGGINKKQIAVNKEKIFVFMEFEVEGEIGKYEPHVIQTRIKENGNLDKEEEIFMLKTFKRCKRHTTTRRIISFSPLNRHPLVWKGMFSLAKKSVETKIYLISGEAHFTKIIFEAVSENGEICVKDYLRMNKLLLNGIIASKRANSKFFATVVAVPHIKGETRLIQIARSQTIFATNAWLQNRLREKNIVGRLQYMYSSAENTMPVFMTFFPASQYSSSILCKIVPGFQLLPNDSYLIILIHG